MKKELGREVDLEEVADKLLSHLAELFDFKPSRILDK